MFLVYKTIFGGEGNIYKYLSFISYLFLSFSPKNNDNNPNYPALIPGQLAKNKEFLGLQSMIKIMKPPRFLDMMSEAGCIYRQKVLFVNKTNSGQVLEKKGFLLKESTRTTVKMRNWLRCS